MSDDILRPRFFEGQYLSPADLIAEQEYHLRMRRALNRALHPPGIVDGLQLVKNEGDGVTSVSAGMAIDGYARDIYVPQPLVLDANALRAAGVTQPVQHAVYLVYRRELAGGSRPSPVSRDPRGVAARWRETATLLIVPDSRKLTVPEDPVIGADIPDDPAASPWPVFLGEIRIGTDPATGIALVVTEVLPDNGGRRYVSLRTSRIQSPAGNAPPGVSLAIEPSVNMDGDLTVAGTITGKGIGAIEGKLTVNGDVVANQKLSVKEDFTASGDARLEKSLLIAGDVSAEKKLKAKGLTEIGLSFTIDAAQVQPPVPVSQQPNFAREDGTLLVEKDAFINQNLYFRKAANSEEFYEIRKYFQAKFDELFQAAITTEAGRLVRELLPKLTPEIQVDSGSHTPVPGTPTFQIVLTAQPGTPVEKVKVIVVLRGVHFKVSGNECSYELSVPNEPVRNGTLINEFIATVQWAAAGVPAAGPAPVKEFFYSYVAIFYPKTTP